MLLRQVRRLFPFFERIFADGSYRREKMVLVVARTGTWKLEIVKRSGGVARPHERNRSPVSRRGVEASDDWLADEGRIVEILEANAIEDVLGCRKAFDQRLGGEVSLWQRLDEYAGTNVAKALGGRNLDQHPRWPVGARPDDARIG